MAAKATLVVKFGGVGGLAYLSAEFDSKRNNKKTTFTSGEQVYFDIWASGPYIVQVSSGVANQIESLESRLIEKEVVSFPKENFANLSKPVSSIQSYQWYGPDFGTIVAAGNSEPLKVTVPSGPEDMIGIATIDYITRYDVWVLTPPASMPDDYAILIVVSG